MLQKKMYEAGQYEQSIPVFEKSLFSDPKNLLARFNYVLALSKSKPTLSVQKNYMIWVIQNMKMKLRNMQDFRQFRSGIIF